MHHHAVLLPIFIHESSTVCSKDRNVHRLPLVENFNNLFCIKHFPGAEQLSLFVFWSILIQKSFIKRYVIMYRLSEWAENETSNWHKMLIRNVTVYLGGSSTKKADFFFLHPSPILPMFVRNQIELQLKQQKMNSIPKVHQHFHLWLSTNWERFSSEMLLCLLHLILYNFTTLA